MARQDPVNVVPSAARTVNGNGSGFSVPKGSVDSDVTQLAVCVNLTAISGTGASITVSVEWSNDGTVWATADPADSFAALLLAGGPAKKVKVFTKKAPLARIAWAVAGTSPSFTFAVDAYGV